MTSENKEKLLDEVQLEDVSGGFLDQAKIGCTPDGVFYQKGTPTPSAVAAPTVSAAKLDAIQTRLEEAPSALKVPETSIPRFGSPE